MANQSNSAAQSAAPPVSRSADPAHRAPSVYREPSLPVRAVRFIRATLAVYMDPVGYARSLGVKIGEDCHIYGSNRDTFGSEPYLIRIGNDVSITHGCNFITHDGGTRMFRKQHPDIDVIAPIIIGNNVLIGAHTVVMPGVTIGDNCIIGVGSVVSRDIPPNSLALGNPARRVKSIDEYWDSIKDTTLPTFHMAPQEKRRFLEQRYHKELFE